MEIKIPTGQCHSCRFFSETEDSDMYCAVYNKSWELMTVGEIEQGEPNPPEFCKATSLLVQESK